MDSRRGRKKILEMLSLIYEDLDIDTMERRFFALATQIFAFDLLALFYVKHNKDDKKLLSGVARQEGKNALSACTSYKNSLFAISTMKKSRASRKEWFWCAKMSAILGERRLYGAKKAKLFHRNHVLTGALPALLSLAPASVRIPKGHKYKP
jgi:hypothetical protein